MLLKKFESNKNGRDLVVGDIHGEFVELAYALKRLRFNPEKDRLFATGDICDRGTHSEDILKWLYYDWFCPVKGNHELMLVMDWMSTDADVLACLKDVGADWFFKLHLIDKKTIIHFFTKLPWVIEYTNTDTGKKTGLVHACCPCPSWEEFISETGISGKGQTEYGKHLMARSIWTHVDRPERIHPVKDIDYIYVGHTSNPTPLTIYNTFLIDTGSGYSNGKLSIFDLKTNKQVF